MSTTIDQNVVEMRFDNKHFENNVQTTMSTLDKLKQKLHLTGASKGLEDINTAAKKVDMTGLGKGVEVVQAKFSALQVMGVTALTNITNSAVNAGKRIVSALTVDPIRTGFQEYETQMGAVQTILANTKSKGSTLDDVNKALDTLNTYADKTIYNFTEMTKNIGTFTAAGVDLQTSVDSIQGIANLAAVSGSTSQQASTAMYQLSQALAAGKVSLMDWNSVVNAGMGGELFQNALIRTSELLDTGAKKAIKAHGSFRESLTKGEWLTTEVLTETLKQISGAYTDAELLAQGYTKEQVKEIQELAQTATSAATEVKTFTQLWDVMKESAQSGWAQTWKLIIGDFEEAKALLTPLADFFTGVIGKMSDARNKLLESALGRSFGDLSKKINSVLEPMKGTAKSIEKVTDSVKDYSKVVDEIIGGDWGNGQARWDKLTEAGYDWAHAQNLVNEKLGDGTRHASKYTEAQKSVNEAQDKGKKTQVELSKNEAKRIEQLANMSDAQLKNLGYTNEQIEAFRELKETSDKLGLPLSEFIEKIDEINGRWLLIESFKNVGDGLIDTFNAIKKAWQDIFPPKTVEEKAEGLFNIIAALHKFTRGIKDAIYVDGEFTEKGENLIRTLKGVFAIIDIVTTIAGGAFKIAFKTLTSILGYFDMDVLSLTACIGDAIVKFRDWLDSTLDFTKAIDKIVPYLKDAAEGIKEWFTGLKETDNIPKYIIQGLVKGLYNGVKTVGEAIWELGKTIIQKICDVLGIQSPSKEFEKVGRFTIEGFIQGIKNGASGAWEAIKSFGEKCIQIIKSIDFGALLGAGIVVGMLVVGNKIAKAIDSLTAPLEGLGDFLTDVGQGVEKALTGLGNMFKGIGFNFKTKGILNLAIAIAVLAGSVFLLTLIEPAKLWNAVGIIVALMAAMAGLVAVIGKFGPSETIQLGKFSLSLIGVSASLLIIAWAVKSLSGLSWEEWAKGLGGIVILLGVFAGIAASSKLLSKSANIDKFGVTILKMAGAMLLMIFVAKIAASMSTEDLVKGGVAVIAFGGIIVGLMAATKLLTGSKNVENVGKTIFKIAGALLLMIFVAKIAASMSTEDLVKGTIAIVAFSGIIVGLMAATKLLTGSKNVGKIGTSMLLISMAIAIMAVTAVLLGLVKIENLAKGIVAVGLLAGMIAGLIYVTKFAGDCQGNLKAITMAIAIITISVIALSFVKPEKLVGATIALGVLMGMFALIVAMSGRATSSVAPLIVMTIAIGMLAGMIYLLSTVPVASALGAAASLSILLLAMSASMVIISKLGSLSPMALVSVGVMTLVMAALAGILYLMSGLPIESTMANVMALSTLLLALSAACVILTIVGLGGPAALIGIGSLLALIVGFGAVTVAIGALISKFPQIEEFIDVGIPILEKLGHGLGSVIGNIIAGFSEAIMETLPKLGLCLSLFMINATPFITGIKMVDGSVLEGIGVLTAAVLALTAADLISGIASFMTGGFAGLGTELSQFWFNAIPFIMGVQTLNPEACEGAKSLAEMILILTAADILDGLTSWLTGGSSLADFGKQLAPFGESMVAFSNTVKGIDAEAVTAAANAGKVMAEMADTLPNSGGLLGKVFGENDIDDFGTQLEKFGKCIVAFSQTVTGNIDEDAVTAAANAGKIMSEMAKNLPNSGGVLGFFAGENDIDDFGTQLEKFGKSIVAFSQTVTGNIDEDAVTAAANAGKVMSELAETLPNSGGVAGFFAGDNDMDDFGTQIEKFGASMVAFSKEVAGNIDEDAVTAAANAGAMMADLANNIPEDGWFDGHVSIEDFGEMILDFGESIVDFSDEVSDADFDSISSAIPAAKDLVEIANSVKDIDEDAIDDFDVAPIGEAIADFYDEVKDVDVSVLSKSVTSATKLKNLVNGLVSLDTTGMSKFKVKSIGTQLKAYANEVSGIDTLTVSNSISAANKLKNLINSLAGVDSSGVGRFKTAIDTLGTVNIDGVVKAFSGSSSKLSNVGGDLIKSLTKGMTSRSGETNSTASKLVESMCKVMTSKSKLFMTIGKNFMSKLAAGINSNKRVVKSTMTTTVTSAATAIRDKRQSFYNAGSHLVSGFASGISENTYKSTAKARAMAAAAASAAKEELDINSPSKVFRRIGMSVPEGFADGIDKLGKVVSNSSIAMARTAINSARGSLSRIADVINSDVDAQPTIRPVLDLSDIKSGAAAIGGILNGRTLSVNTEMAGVVSASMLDLQNGSDSSDIVSAIKGLRKDIADMPRNSYNINGITYDDGSNITDAVKSIVRAARVERRI